MKQHTNEPWHAAEIARDSDTFVKICHANGGTIAKLWIDVDDSDFSDGQRADARRIVACVNACEGVDTELLEKGDLDNPVMKIIKEKSALKQQRDELLALANNFQITGPDEDGVVWLLLHGSGTTGKAMFSLGSVERIAVQVALHLETERQSSLAKGGTA